jgi:N-acyl-D-amino-acid deacylase
MPAALTRRSFLASGFALPFAPSLQADDGPALAPFDDLLTRFVKDNDVPGAAIAVTRAGKLVHARGFGHADAAKKFPVKPGSLFRIASISKPITAVAVLQLIERGKIKLNDPVLRHFHLKPFLATSAKADKRWEKITVRHCLQHTGGWDRD